jgi:hypothetical protein
MILFKPEHVPMILSGRKTQTRRLGKKRWNVGAVHQCQTRMMDNTSVFAFVRIRDVRQETLSDISDADIYAEGYDSFPEYWAVLCAINGGMSPCARLWRVEFERVWP